MVRIPALLAFLIALALPQLATAADTRADLIPRRLIFGNPDRSAPMISPDGTMIAYTAAREGVMNVWVAPVNDLAAAKPVTNERKRPVLEFKWALNGRYLLYFQDSAGDENFHLFAVDLKDNTTRDLTPFKSVRAEIIAQSYARPDEILVGLNNRDERWHDAWLTNVVTGESRLTEKNTGFAAFVADSDLKVRLAAKPRTDGGHDYLRLEGKSWQPLITVSSEDALTTEPLSYRTGTTSLYMIDSRGRDKSALNLLDTKTGAARTIASSQKSDIARIISDPQTMEALAASFEYDRMEWRAISPALSPDIRFLNGNISGTWYPLSQSRDNNLWTLWIDTPGKPIRFALYDRNRRSLTSLYTARPALEAIRLPVTTPHVLKSRDGLDLVSYLTLPRETPTDREGRPLKALPMVLAVHGGPWIRDSLAYNPQTAWLANRGYAVLSVNFRGSTGFGKAFVNAGDREWGGKMHDDLIDAVNWAISRKIAIRDRIAIYGGSYGGYAVLTGLTRTPVTFACGVDIVGPSNLMTLLSSFPAYWQSFADIFHRRVGNPATAEGRALLRDRSPVFRAASIRRPLLIGQGANDPRVRQSESDSIVNAMKAKGLPVTYALYADEGHGFARAPNRLSFNAITEQFLAQCLGGKAEPIGADLEGSSVAVPVGKEHITGLSDALEEP